MWSTAVTNVIILWRQDSRFTVHLPSISYKLSYLQVILHCFLSLEETRSVSCMVNSIERGNCRLVDSYLVVGLIHRVIRMIKTSIMRWAWHLGCVWEIKNGGHILFGNLREKLPFRRSRRRCEDNIKIVIRLIRWGSAEWIRLVPDRDLWLALSNTVWTLSQLRKKALELVGWLVTSLASCSCRWSETVCELRPPTGLLFIPQFIYECGELRWNYIDRRKPKNSDINLSQCHFVNHKSHTDWPRRDPGPTRS
jgi:hypothetical protein